MKIRALVVDDERLARVELKKLLEEQDRVEVIGEADNAEKAVELVDQYKPDVVFLDIQMPGRSGLDAVEAFCSDVYIVFVTAYDRYAIRAFEVNALDYLLKPVKAERLSSSLARVRAMSTSRANIGSLEYDDPLFLTLNGHSTFLPVKKIACIQSAGDYTEVCSIDSRRGLVNLTLKQWAERLPRHRFVRIHRSALVNVEHVTKIEKRKNYTYGVYVKGFEEPLSMSRRYARLVKNELME